VAALGRGVLEHEVFAGGLDRVAAAAGDLALGQLEEPADAVRLVHDVVAGLELQRVDDVLPPAGKLLDLPGVVTDGAAVELALAHQGELDLRDLEAVRDGGLEQVGDAGFGVRREFLDDPGGQFGAGEHVGGAVDETGALGDDGDGPAVLHPAAEVPDGAFDAAGEARHGVALDADGEQFVDLAVLR